MQHLADEAAGYLTILKRIQTKFEDKPAGRTAATEGLIKSVDLEISVTLML